MKKRYSLFFVIGLVFTILFSGWSTINKKNPIKYWGLDVNSSLADGLKHKPSPRASTPAKPSRSGVVTKVPWENDREFKKVQKRFNCPVRMAAFCTVLRDPLPGEEQNVHLGARLLAGTVVMPGEVFSQNRAIGPYNRHRGFGEGPTYMGTQLRTTVGGGVCKIASTLYNVAILSDLHIVERHAHSMPVPYVPYGQDATVAYGVRDFKFKNNSPYPILIWAEGIDNRLYIAFYGRQEPPRVEWHHEVIKQINTYKIYRNNPELPPGSQKTVVEGMDGAIIKSWVSVIYPGKNPQTKYLGSSHYNPMPYIIEKGNAPPS